MDSAENEVKPNSGFLRFLVALYVAAFVGYLGLRRGLGWYGGLVHPNAALPSWAFGPIWVALCLLLGYVGWLLWTSAGSKFRRLALTLFIIQIVLQSVWLWMLFGIQKPYGSMISLSILVVVAVASFFVGHRVKPITAILIVPFLLWLCYAGFLNFGIWSLNYRNSGGVSHIETTIRPG